MAAIVSPGSSSRSPSPRGGRGWPSASLTTLHTSFRDELDPWLGLPPEIPTCALLPIGWPLGRYGTPPRESVDEKLFFERYDPERRGPED